MTNYFDAGIFHYLRPTGPLDRPSEIEGGALEGLVGQHLHAWCDSYSSQQDKHTLTFWRTRSGLEVDFIVYGAKVFSAIEVKNSLKLNPKEDLKGLKAFREEYPEAQSILLYRGKKQLTIDGISCIPCEDFLSRITPNETFIK